MDREALVQLITRAVLAALGEGSPTAAPGPGHRLLVACAGGEQGAAAAAAELAALRQAGAVTRLVCSPSARTVLGDELISRLGGGTPPEPPCGDAMCYGLVEWAQAVIVPVLTQNTAAKVALGIRDSLLTNLLAAAIVTGKPVIMAQDAAVPAGAPAAYGAMIAGHLDRLRGFGVQVVRADHLAETCRQALRRGGAVPPPARAPQSRTPAALPPSPYRTVITAQTVQDAARAGEHSLAVPPGALVTPLATDEARALQIRLEW